MINWSSPHISDVRVANLPGNTKEIVMRITSTWELDTIHTRLADLVFMLSSDIRRMLSQTWEYNVRNIRMSTARAKPP